MRDTLPISVIIVAWNCWTDLFKCINSITYSTKRPDEIIVVDNASIDGTGDKVRSTFPAVRLVQNTSNLGHTRAVNQGMALAASRYILVLDADTELQPDCIEQLTNYLEERTDVSMVGPRTLNTDGSIQESARNFPSAMSALFGRQSFLTRSWPNNPFSHRYLARANLGVTDPFRVQQIGGAAMLFRRSLLDEVGPWDEGYFAYWVDTDWCLRMSRAGKAIYCVPGAVVVHHEGNARHKKRSVSRIVLFHRGALRLYRKWYTRGPFDPRLWLAALGLTIRSLLQITVNASRSSQS